MIRLSKIMRACVIVVFLLSSSCTMVTHVDEFETMQPEIEQCVEQNFNINLSDECAFCRCTKCDVEIRECGLRCWDIVLCAIENRCDPGDDMSSCVAEKCPTVLERAQAGVEQASTLAVCIRGCNDVCLTL